MDKNPFLKYLIKDKKEDIVHSSAYAKVQNEGSFGAASTQSFEERQKIEANRQIISKYSDSRIMRQARANAPKAKAYVQSSKDGGSSFDRKTNLRNSTNPSNNAQNRAMMPRRNPGISR